MIHQYIPHGQQSEFYSSHQSTQEINHLPSWYLSQAEREFLVYFDASCKTPIAAHAEYIDESIIKARYMYGDFEGNCLEFHTETGDKICGKEIAIKAAEIIEAKKY